MTLLVEPPFAAPSAEAVMARAAGENFPVASRLLPRAERADLLARLDAAFAPVRAGTTFPDGQ